MNVTQVNKWFKSVGGIENHVRTLASGLANIDGVASSVLACNSSLRTEVYCEDGVNVVKVGATPRIARMPWAPTFPLWLRRTNADVLHFHHPFPPGELAYLAARPKGKLVVSFHCDIVAPKLAPILYAPVLRTFLRRADRILISSTNLMRHSPVAAQFEDKCTVIPYGIDVARFSGDEETVERSERIRSRYGSPLLLYVGKIRHYKGIEVLIEAMKHIDGVLLVVGTGPWLQRALEAAGEFQVAEKIEFLPHASDEALPAYYRACDVFVLPSTNRSEAFGIVQLEAMASGKPVVSTNLPTSVPFVNQHEETGLVVPPGDVRALAEAITAITTDDSVARRFGSNGRRRVETMFTAERMLGDIREVYEQIL